MEHLLACSFADYLRSHGIINSEYYDIYVYGTELVLSFLITASLIVLLGLILKKVLQSVIFLFIFVLLRRFTGGYHANTYIKCKIITISTFLITVTASQFIDVEWYLYFALLITGNVLIYFFAPIENLNKPLTRIEKKKFKKYSHIIFSVISTIGMITALFITDTALNIVFFTLVSVIMLIIIPKFMKGATRHEIQSC